MLGLRRCDQGIIKKTSTINSDGKLFKNVIKYFGNDEQLGQVEDSDAFIMIYNNDDRAIVGMLHRMINTRIMLHDDARTI